MTQLGSAQCVWLGPSKSPQFVGATEVGWSFEEFPCLLAGMALREHESSKLLR
jgi:hypothetical protein